MGLTYLLDTNVISELERSQPQEGVLAGFQRYHDTIALAAVSWHELLFGYYRLPDSRRRARIRHFLFETVAPLIPILPFEARAADWLALERARLGRSGRPIPFADGQIAAVAAANNLILVTRNRADFAPFANLQVENWFED